MLYGVRKAGLAAGVEDFRAAGIAVELATDDGSAGHRGFVTDLLAQRLDRGERPARVVGCGPPAMLAALSRLVARHSSGYQGPSLLPRRLMMVRMPSLRASLSRLASESCEER